MNSNYERDYVPLGTFFIDLSEFNNKTPRTAAQLLTHGEAILRERYTGGVRVVVESSRGDIYLNAYRLETDEEHTQRVNNLLKKEASDRERELATLKKLQAKYPDVKFEM